MVCPPIKDPNPIPRLKIPEKIDIVTELVFSSAAYDMSRYNLLYNSFVNQYGYPVSTQSNNGGVSATWWGYNNGYITLSFFGDYANNGAYRYYTTVSYGN